MEATGPRPLPTTATPMEVRVPKGLPSRIDPSRVRPACFSTPWPTFWQDRRRSCWSVRFSFASGYVTSIILSCRGELERQISYTYTEWILSTKCDRVPERTQLDEWLTRLFSPLISYCFVTTEIRDGGKFRKESRRRFQTTQIDC
jgi:hypothetical protein